MFDARRLLSLAALTAVLAGCGAEEGDYLIYRVAFESEDASGGCWWPNDGPPPEEAASRNTYLFSSTLAIYVGFDGNDLLDVITPFGAITLPEDEELDEGDMAFTGVTTDVNYIGIDQSEAVISTTTFNTLVMETSGSAVEGTLTSKEVIECDFLTATPSGDVCPAPAPPDCLRKFKFSGVELDDVTVYESVDKSGAPPPPMP